MPTRRAACTGTVDQVSSIGSVADRYGTDVLANNPHDTLKSRRPRSVERAAEIGMVVEDAQSGYVGAVLRVEAGNLELEDRRGRVRVFPLGPGFLVDGQPVILTAPQRAAATATRTKSGSVKVDGLYIQEFRHVYNTSGASGAVLVPGGGALHSKWGAAGDTDGCQVLFLGAQALGMADIGAPEWNEKGFDYDNSQGIAMGKILGFLKPKFGTIYENNTVEDFGVLSCYVAQ